MSKDVRISGGEVFITEKTSALYEVVSGEVLIYIVPVEADGSYGRRYFVCRMKEGEKIPALCYSDLENNRWCFAAVAVERAVIRECEHEADERSKKDFCQKAGLHNYEIEGFEEGLVEWYRLQILKEDGYIHKTGMEQKQAYRTGLDLIYGVLNKKQKINPLKTKNNVIYDAVSFLCRMSKIGVADFERVKEACKKNVTVEDIARVSHFVCRKTVLEEKWYKKDFGNILVYSGDGKKLYACIYSAKGYRVYDPETEKTEKLTFEKAKTMSCRAYVCYRPLPNKIMSLRELLCFGADSVSKTDMLMMAVISVLGAAAGILVPIVTEVLYDSYIPIGASGALVQLCFALLGVILGSLAFAVVKNLCSLRMAEKITHCIQCAVYDRLFNLPESFFRKYDSGDIAGRVTQAGRFVGRLAQMLIDGALAAFYAAVYAAIMLCYAPTLGACGAIMVLMYSTIWIIVKKRSLKHRQESSALSGKTDGVLYQLLSGINKIRISGVEDRVLVEYLIPYTEFREKSSRSDRNTLVLNSLTVAAYSLFSVVLYSHAVMFDVGISIGAFLAFAVAFGSFGVCAMRLSEILAEITCIKNKYERIKPITQTLAEIDDSGELVGEFYGEIDISNVNFAYDEVSENVLTDINLHIKPGEYVGVVGASGSGKSTLLKLLLGFEKPDAGKIYYDGRDIESFDKRELRKKFGVVLQDGKLISGSIYENITASCPDASYDDVENAINMAGLSADIESMPMGLHTILREDAETVSGGQKQKILIARALAAKPEILLFDEATSALDNVTQREICERLRAVEATKIVIAHRLSTVKNCDRIIVLDNGKAVEQGSYDELMKKNGLFSSLVQRQLS